MQINFAITAKLINAFVFATRIVQFRFVLNPKFQASSLLLYLYSLAGVGPGQNPNCWFSHAHAHFSVACLIHMILMNQTWDQSSLQVHLSRLMGKPTMWFPNRSDTNQAAQSQKQARSLKFRIYVEEELYYPSSENKGADQLRGYRESDLRLCFRLCKLLIFSRGCSFLS